jgi:hypothetical protein
VFDLTLLALFQSAAAAFLALFACMFAIAQILTTPRLFSASSLDFQRVNREWQLRMKKNDFMAEGRGEGVN